MKNIMFIAVATLTIATANAIPWSAVHPIQIVNNTTVQLEFRTWPSGQYFTLQPNTSAYATNAGDTQLFFGWGVDDTGAGPVILTQSFDDTQQTGSMSKASVSISGIIDLGTAWHIGNFGSNDIITLTADDPGTNTRMQLTATRTRGVTVVRGWGDDNFAADLFCLDTGVEFDLPSHGALGRCPAGETQIVIVDSAYIQFIDDWNEWLLQDAIQNICIYNVGCKPNQQEENNINGEYINGFATVPYSNSNSPINLSS